MKGTYKIAAGGICAAICAVILIISGVISFGQYAAAVLAGVILLVLSYRTGAVTALCSFTAASVTAFIFSADRSGLLLFVLLTGYYPLLHSVICEKMSVPAAFIVKLFFSCATGTIYVMTFLFILDIRPVYALSDDKLFAAIMVIIYILLFFAYDTALTLFEKGYKKKIICFLERIIK